MTNTIHTIDDAINLIAFKNPKSKNVQPLNLNPDYFKKVRLNYKNQNPVIISYQQQIDDKFIYISPDEYFDLPEKVQALFKPCYEKVFYIDENSKCIFNKNIIKLFITNLSDNPVFERERFIYNSLNKLHEYGIINSGDNYSDYWQVSSYEWNLIFKTHGKLIIDDLKAKVKTMFNSSVYLTTPEASTHIKFYNMTAKSQNRTTNFSVNDTYKLEITFKKKKVIKEIYNYKSFEEITFLYKKDIIKGFKVFYNFLSKYTKNKIKLELNVSNDKDLFKKIVSPEISLGNSLSDFQRKSFYFKEKIKMLDNFFD